MIAAHVSDSLMEPRHPSARYPLPMRTRKSTRDLSLCNAQPLHSSPERPWTFNLLSVGKRSGSADPQIDAGR
jgi:hypothetical protein